MKTSLCEVVFKHCYKNNTESFQEQSKGRKKNISLHETVKMVKFKNQMCFVNLFLNL